MFAFHVAPEGILIAQAPWAVVNAVIQFEVKAIAGIRIGAIALVVGIAGAIVGKNALMPSSQRLVLTPLCRGLMRAFGIRRVRSAAEG